MIMYLVSKVVNCMLQASMASHGPLSNAAGCLHGTVTQNW